MYMCVCMCVATVFEIVNYCGSEFKAIRVITLIIYIEYRISSTRKPTNTGMCFQFFLLYAFKFCGSGIRRIFKIVYVFF